MYGTIYKITNIETNKIYIGKTVKPIEKRFLEHLKTARRPRTYTSYLYNAINSYGDDKFIIEAVEECEDEQSLDKREKYWIGFLHSQDPGIGYNIQEGGEGGAVRSKEFVPSSKMLASLERGRHLPSSFKHKQQLAERRRGCTVSQETRDKLRQGSADRVRIHKGEKNLHPKREFLQDYLNDGWELGYFKSSKFND